MLSQVDRLSTQLHMLLNAISFTVLLVRKVTPSFKLTRCSRAVAQQSDSCLFRQEFVLQQLQFVEQMVTIEPSVQYCVKRSNASDGRYAYKAGLYPSAL
jgi:hypothetical protein